MNFDAIPLGDPRWEATLSRCDAGIFYTPDFCRFRVGSSGRPMMLRYEDELGLVVDVTCVKDIASLAFCQALDRLFSTTLVDIASPEYNGPVLEGDVQSRPELLRRYRKAVDQFCADSNVVTEFVRMHPMSKETGELSDIVELVPASEMVYVDLRQGYEAARSRYTSKRRQEVNRACRAGARMEVVTADGPHIERFTALYDGVMRGRNAKSVRIFGYDYFREFFNCLGKDALLVEAFIKDTLASSTIFLLDGKNVWALYEGTVGELRDSDANLFKTDRMIEWSAQNGFYYFLLGGGELPGDGMYTYKMRYSKAVMPVRHLRKIHDRLQHEFLVEGKAAYDRHRGATTRLDYFPSYWLD